MIDLQDNLFAMTESLSSEDLTSAVLAYLLWQPSEHAYRTLFCNRVLGYHPPPSVSAVRFQDELGEYGRADLTIKDREAFYLAEIARALGVDHGRGTSGSSAAQAVESHFASLGVTFRVLTWEDVLYDFSTGSEVVRALHAFIHARYIQNREFTAKEIEMLDSDLVNAVVSQAQEVLARIRADLEG